MSENEQHFLKSLGFPEVRVHHSLNHFDFTKGGRRILVIGPMGSGKTEFAARIWRDAKVSLGKSMEVEKHTSGETADRRRVFFVRSKLDAGRFLDYPDDALAYRGGYERLGESLARVDNSFELESVVHDHPDAGTWIVDEASFYEERLVYVILKQPALKDLIFVFPTLILNFRKDIFNPTARMLLDGATDIFPLTAYCDHPDCIRDSFYTYRYYLVDGNECPALYFDPLIIIGGDVMKQDPRQPNYATRCDQHHLLPGKEYTFLVLKPLGEAAGAGEEEPLRDELALLAGDVQHSRLTQALRDEHGCGDLHMNALRVDCIAEKALFYLYSEQTLLSSDQFRAIASELNLDRQYLNGLLKDNGRRLRLA